MIFGGIDVAKHRHELCLTDDAGGVIRQMFIDNSQKGFQKLLQAMDHLGMEPGGVEFCMEAGEIPGFPADRAIHLVIRDLVNHCNFGKVGDLAPVTLMAESGAPFRSTIAGTIVAICLMINLRRQLLFG